MLRWFWHKITELEIYQALSNSKWNSKGQIEEKLHQLIQLNMKRGETDNITVIYIGKVQKIKEENYCGNNRYID